MNIICAGRPPNNSDLSAIKKAGCVILPQGCSQALYEMATQNSPHVFPNYDAKFSYPGKIGQIHLFQSLKVHHPSTQTFSCLEDYDKQYKKAVLPMGLTYPVVFKNNWGGEGDTVFRIDSHDELIEKLAAARQYEKYGQSGFVIQEYIPAGNRVLRVVIIGKTLVSYWRVNSDSSEFVTNLRRNGVIDRKTDPHLQEKAICSAIDFCKKTGINLAGFDFLFSTETSFKEPLFLEINYFFGRKGLGGSQRYYDLLVKEIRNWIHSFLPMNA